MLKHLYFICPTDNIETIIENTFSNTNYYLSSLGNTINFDQGFIEEVNAQIRAKGISEITFILSDTNRIILDLYSLEEKKSMENIDKFFSNQRKNKEDKAISEHEAVFHSQLIATYLYSKIRELQLAMSESSYNHLKVNAQVYNRQMNMFTKIKNSTACYSSFSIN